MEDTHSCSAETLRTKASQVRDADRCVMCGLCLPHCPTYQLFRQEGTSPRGRIALIKALANGNLTPSKKVVQHLDGCLMCRRCETVCPAQVPFGRLLDRARHALATQAITQHAATAATRLPVWLSVFAQHRAVQRLSATLLRRYHHSGLRTLLRTTRLLKLLRLATFDTMLPPHMPRLTMPSRREPRRAKIALFVGCTGAVFDSATITAAQRLLDSIGFSVTLPRRHHCCGAMHQHAGDRRTAAVLLRQNSAAFRQTPRVISCATGCGMQLREHATHLGIHHDDIHAFLLRQSATLRFREHVDSISLHVPCTMQNDVSRKLLSLVPRLNIRLLTQAGACCGGAGAYMLTHPQTAQALLKPFLDMLAQHRAHTLLTANVGCALHFRRGLAMRQMDVEVMHPVSWLEKNALIRRKQRAGNKQAN